MPKWVKILSIVLAIAGWGFVINLYISERRKIPEFYNKEIRSTVIKSGSFHARAIEFHLRDGTTVVHYPPIGEKIAIGDSIFKPRNSFIYRVYRKGSDNEYKFIEMYDYQKTN